jgi:glycosyltransferase involved in cell wall biosynthesis
MQYFQKSDMSTNEKPQLIFLGKLPPPFIGPSLACQMILNSKLKDEFNLIHLNTSDHRDISTLGKIDLGNSYLAIKQYFMLINLLLKYKKAMVYIPAGQTTVGYIRDAIFIVIAKMFGRKVITHLRGGNFLNWYNSAPNYAKWVVRKVHPKVDAQIILGNNLRPLFNWLLSEDRIHVIPNGGNYTIPKVNRTDDKIVILFLGNFIGTKGVLQVLYASEYLADLKDKIEFRFAGAWRDEPTKAAFLKFKEEHPELPINIVGQVSGVAKFEVLASSDIFTFPTFYPNEGHPWVIVEAMCAGLPVISTDHAAISECVIDGKNGFLVPKQDIKSVAEKIRFLVKNPDIRKQMGIESRKLYESGLTHDIMIERLGKVFNKVANENY